MKKILMSVFIFVLLLTGCASNTEVRESVETSKVSAEESIQLLNNATKITVEKQLFSLANKYSVIVEGEEVATVEGKIANMFGDKFTMYDTDGNVIVEEKEIKRFGRLNRSAEIKDNEDNVLGYIGEETVTKFTSIGYYFHFFDKDKEQIGISDQVNISVLKKNNFKDNDGNIDYTVKKNFDIVNSYDIEIADKNDIPLYFAILMVCIEDAIASAEEK